MKATDLRHSGNAGIERWADLCRSARRRISQLSVDSIFVVVVDVLAEPASQMVFVEDDYMVQ